MLAAAKTPAEADAIRLKLVKDYADNVLKDASDRYHFENPSPLLAGGINVFTKEQLKWIFPENANFPEGREAVWSDFAVQQNFMRILASLTNLTGDPKYKDSAKAQYAYYFAHHQSEGGLLEWGGHRFVDLLTGSAVGMRDSNLPNGAIPTDTPHELKNAFPYYELMYETDPKKTQMFIEAFWNAHIYNWETMETSRHGQFTHPPGPQWDKHVYKNPDPFFETLGLSFLDAGNDLIYAGAMLYKFTGDKGALLWTQRQANNYVKARNPKTHLGAYQFTQAHRQHDPPTDVNAGDFTFSEYGDRAKRQIGPDFPGHLVLEATILFQQQATAIYCDNALMEIQVASTMGEAGKEMVENVRIGMDAFVDYALIPDKNLLRPMLTDGTDLSGYVLKERGYYGPKGHVMEPYTAGPEFMLSYARAFLITGDPKLWTMARSIAQASGLGDIGVTPGKEIKLNMATDNARAEALFSVLDLYKETKVDEYLQLARAIGNNIVKQYYHYGYFTPYDDTLFANINAIEPYALLALEATIKGTPDKVPYFLNGFGFYAGFYRFGEGKSREVSEDFLFRARKSNPNPPAFGAS